MKLLSEYCGSLVNFRIVDAERRVHLLLSLLRSVFRVDAGITSPASERGQSTSRPLSLRDNKGRVSFLARLAAHKYIVSRSTGSFDELRKVLPVNLKSKWLVREDGESALPLVDVLPEHLHEHALSDSSHSDDVLGLLVSSSGALLDCTPWDRYSGLSLFVKTGLTPTRTGEELAKDLLVYVLCDFMPTWNILSCCKSLLDPLSAGREGLASNAIFTIVASKFLGRCSARAGIDGYAATLDVSLSVFKAWAALTPSKLPADSPRSPIVRYLDDILARLLRLDQSIDSVGHLLQLEFSWLADEELFIKLVGSDGADGDSNLLESLVEVDAVKYCHIVLRMVEHIDTSSLLRARFLKGTFDSLIVLAMRGCVAEVLERSMSILSVAVRSRVSAFVESPTNARGSLLHMISLIEKRCESGFWSTIIEQLCLKFHQADTSDATIASLEHLCPLSVYLGTRSNPTSLTQTLSAEVVKFVLTRVPRIVSQIHKADTASQDGLVLVRLANTLLEHRATINPTTETRVTCDVLHVVKVCLNHGMQIMPGVAPGSRTCFLRLVSNLLQARSMWPSQGKSLPEAIFQLVCSHKMLGTVLKLSPEDINVKGKHLLLEIIEMSVISMDGKAVFDERLWKYLLESFGAGTTKSDVLTRRLLSSYVAALVRQLSPKLFVTKFATAA